MDNKDYSTKQRKYQHLRRDERYEIQVRLKDGWSIYWIAKALDRSYNTIKQEIARGTVPLYDGNVKLYKAEAGQHNYEEHRTHCRKRYKRLG